MMLLPATTRPQPRLALPSLATPATSAAPQELHGVADGQPITLPSGIVIDLRRVGDQRVTTQELVSAVAGINALPTTDQRLIAAAGVHVNLLPVAVLEQAADGRSLLGGTTILRDESSDTWTPTVVRVAVRAGRAGRESTPEIVQHELGHVVSVLQRQDRSEQAAELYAGRY